MFICNTSSLLLLFAVSACAFAQQTKLTPRHSSSLFAIRGNLEPTSAQQKLLSVVTSKASKAASFALLLASIGTVNSANAKVFIDTDLYGDKELKIATINKLKQKLRDAINKDYSIAPCMLELTINDALGYNAATTGGGPDGSIQFEADIPGNEGLKKVIDVVNQIKKELQRTNTVSFADIVAFGGAEALETAGCARITVQIGRDDAKAANKLQNDKAIDWHSSELTAACVRKSFENSGLTVREMGLLVGALGELRRITSDALSSSKDSNDEEDDVLAGDQSFEDLVPSTFGSRDKMYGAKMGKGNFGSTYLKNLAKAPADDNLKPLLTGDQQILEVARKYAGGDKVFQTGVADAYLKLTLLGEAYSTRNSS